MTAISNFHRASKGRDPTDARVESEIKLLKDTFQGWEDDVRAITKAMSETNDGLMERAEMRLTLHGR